MSDGIDGSTEAVPGTIRLLDVNHDVHARHADGGEILMVPTPSNDPEDPLNWAPRRKLMATICTIL